MTDRRIAGAENTFTMKGKMIGQNLSWLKALPSAINRNSGMVLEKNDCAL